MARRERDYVIAQFSDVHCGDARFDDKLMLRVIREINEAGPDLVVVPGDLTQAGYAEQFEQFAGYLELLDCPERVVIAGNHDCRNVGYLLHERYFGPRTRTCVLPFAPDGPGASVKVFAVDSNIPDLNDGEVGRQKVLRVAEEFAEPSALRMFVLHHHLVSIPGTGRERNVVWDAGDVLQALLDADVDLVLAGHKHVPHVWPLRGMLVITSGTAASHRTRGETEPSYNLISVGRERIAVTIRGSGGGEVTEAFPRQRRQRPGSAPGR